MTVFAELTIVLAAVVAVSFVMRFLKQPLVVGYILTGILVGPLFLNVTQSHDTFELFSKIGITILLFIVGLHLSPKVIKEVGSVSLVTGIGQVVFTSVMGFLISIMLGLPTIAAFYVAIALTFSSTIIILKLLSDKGHTHTLYGKISIGFLLVQDVIASVFLILISSFSDTSEIGIIPAVTLLVLKALGVLLSLFIITHWVLPRVVQYSSKSQELLFVFSLTWGLSLASIFQILGLSVEIGALIAGVTLSSMPVAEEISAKLKPLRDFFIIIFFISLGSTMTFTNLSALIVPAVVLSLYVLVGNPIIMIILMNLLGYHKKTSFMAGLTVAQISEFSLILANLGLLMGHISAEILTMITLVGLVTIAGSTYLILYAEKLYPSMEKILTLLELRKNNASNKEDHEDLDILLFGGDRISASLIKMAKKQQYDLGIVDFNPELVTKYGEQNIPVLYGDASNVEFLGELPLNKVKLVISTIPSHETNMILTKFIRKHKKKVKIVIFTNQEKEAEELYEAGASYVALPHLHAADFITRNIVRSGLDAQSFTKALR